MKIRTSITGIGSTARDRAAALIQQALAKREAELAARPPPATIDSGTINLTPSQGGQ
jgi:hypothetical protein